MFALLQEEQTKAQKIRFNDLGIYDIYMGNNRKMEPLNDYISKKKYKT